MLYLDSSALVKLIVDEPESAALKSVIGNARVLSSDLAVVEVGRAARRHEAAKRGDSLVEQLDTIAIDADILRVATEVEPASLSSLDAVHVASALFAWERIDRFVAYDGRLLEAARANGLDVASPS